jgi:taurine dioxygenase
MSFNNLDNVYKQIARVGNINLDGSLKNNYTDAAYWHQDGNFWGPEDKRIINCLHSKE